MDEGGDWEGSGWTWAGEGGSDDREAFVVLAFEIGGELVGIEVVDGYCRRAVEVAVRATFEDEDPILVLLGCVTTKGRCATRQMGLGDFMSFS